MRSTEAERSLDEVRLQTRDLLEAGGSRPPQALAEVLGRWLQATRIESLTGVELDDVEQSQTRCAFWAWVLFERDGQELCVPLHFECEVTEPHGTLKLGSEKEERPASKRVEHLSDQVIQWSFATFIGL